MERVEVGEARLDSLRWAVVATLTIQSWNILHGGGRRLPEIALCLLEHAADVIVLSEFRQRRGGQLRGVLADHGWAHQVSTPAGGGENGVLVASRAPLVAGEGPAPPACLRTRWVEATLAESGVRVVGVHLPEDGRRDDQRRAWAFLLARARELAGRPTVLVGDFNAGRNGIDGAGRFAASEQMGRLWSLGYADAWREMHPGEHEASWGGPASGEVDARAGSPCHRAGGGGPGHRTGVRIDHACVSPPLRGSVRRACFLQAERARGLSDHAPLLVALEAPDAGNAAVAGGENGGETPKNQGFWGRSPTWLLAGERKTL